MLKQILSYLAAMLVVINASIVLVLITNVPTVYKTVDGKCVELVEGYKCSNLPRRYSVVYLP
jgi:hypothetical protein